MPRKEQKEGGSRPKNYAIMAFYITLIFLAIFYGIPILQNIIALTSGGEATSDLFGDLFSQFMGNQTGLP
jgi:hypothetical protein